MKLMQNVKEIYSKDGKNLLELIQEWVDENNYLFYSQYNEENANINKK